jgi:hypothetical protein
MPTASGAITIRTADGEPIGHGWGEVRVRRDPMTGRPSTLGELRRMTWLTDLGRLDACQSYVVGFYGGPSFVGVFDSPLPGTGRRHATFRPSGPVTVPTGPTRSAWPTIVPVPWRPH